MANNSSPIFNYYNEFVGFENYTAPAIMTAEAFLAGGKLDAELAPILDRALKTLAADPDNNDLYDEVESLYPNLMLVMDRLLCLAKDDKLAVQISEIFTDKTPAEMLADPEQVKSLPHFKTREAIISTPSSEMPAS